MCSIGGETPIIENSQWPGSEIEKFALIRAVSRNCGCDRAMGYILRQAGCHELLVPPTNQDPYKWHRLVFARRRAGTLLVQELGPQHRIKWLPSYTKQDIELIHKLGK